METSTQITLNYLNLGQFFVFNIYITLKIYFCFLFPEAARRFCSQKQYKGIPEGILNRSEKNPEPGEGGISFMFGMKHMCPTSISREGVGMSTSV
jgi:hypothetical protein